MSARTHARADFLYLRLRVCQWAMPMATVSSSCCLDSRQWGRGRRRPLNSSHGVTPKRMKGTGSSRANTLYTVHIIACEKKLDVTRTHRHYLEFDVVAGSRWIQFLAFCGGLMGKLKVICQSKTLQRQNTKGWLVVDSAAVFVCKLPPVAPKHEVNPKWFRRVTQYSAPLSFP
jgi:hypothetical protein